MSVTIKDLQEDCTIDPFATAPQLGAPEAIPLTFGRMNTVIAFTNILGKYLHRFSRIIIGLMSGARSPTVHEYPSCLF